MSTLSVKEKCTEENKTEEITKGDDNNLCTDSSQGASKDIPDLKLPNIDFTEGEGFENAKYFAHSIFESVGSDGFECDRTDLEGPDGSHSDSSLSWRQRAKVDLALDRKIYPCDECAVTFRTPYELLRHKRIHSGERPYRCNMCDATFKRKDHLDLHKRRHEANKYQCQECNMWFVTLAFLNQHIHTAHGIHLTCFISPNDILVDQGGDDEVQQESNTTSVFPNLPPLPYPINTRSITITTKSTRVTTAPQNTNLTSTSSTAGRPPNSQPKSSNYGQKNYGIANRREMPERITRKKRYSYEEAVDNILFFEDEVDLIQYKYVKGRRGKKRKIKVEPGKQEIGKIEENYVKKELKEFDDPDSVKVESAKNVADQLHESFEKIGKQEVTTESHESLKKAEEKCKEGNENFDLAESGKKKDSVENGNENKEIQQAVAATEAGNNEPSEKKANFFFRGLKKEIVSTKTEKENKEQVGDGKGNSDEGNELLETKKKSNSVVTRSKRTAMLEESKKNDEGGGTYRTRSTRTTAIETRRKVQDGLKKKYECETCTVLFKSPSELNRHVRIHTGERPFTCELCASTFIRKCHLDLHLRRHRGEKKFSCQQCQMRFVSSSDLVRHETTHSKDRPYQCSLCEMSYSRITHLEQHLVKHTQLHYQECRMCPAVFFKPMDLLKHEELHCNDGIYACIDCSSKFYSPAALIKHRPVHEKSDAVLSHELLQANGETRNEYACYQSSPLSLVFKKIKQQMDGKGDLMDVPVMMDVDDHSKINPSVILDHKLCIKNETDVIEDHSDHLVIKEERPDHDDNSYDAGIYIPFPHKETVPEAATTDASNFTQSCHRENVKCLSSQRSSNDPPVHTNQGLPWVDKVMEANKRLFDIITNLRKKAEESLKVGASCIEKSSLEKAFEEIKEKLKESSSREDEKIDKMGTCVENGTHNIENSVENVSLLKESSQSVVETPNKDLSSTKLPREDQEQNKGSQVCTDKDPNTSPQDPVAEEDSEKESNTKKPSGEPTVEPGFPQIQITNVWSEHSKSDNACDNMG
ncbi:uncharacterized protein LOC143026536 [Oratosquilla oratoria]|uniref:uncharacterized protein LOC143026536 n=1 Tax=Oratosquilla oratoria TaxID=337810 RepID=UPI003F75D9D0